MSFQPKIFFDGKRCFVYCGDEKCDCDLSPNYPKNKQPIFFDIKEQKNVRCLKTKNPLINGDV